MSHAVKLACALGLFGLALAVRSASSEDAKPAAAVLRHVVFFKFKPEVDAAKLKELVDAFRALPSKIDAIQAFEYGTDVGVEGLSKGFTHCFLLTFADEKGRDAYLPHPAHQEFVGVVKPLLDDVCVIDYWTKQ